MKRQQIVDQKNRMVYAFWSLVNKIVLARQFNSIEIVGKENIPQNSGFMLVANHSSRWDGLLVYNLIGRPSNFLVHPNELLGFQGVVLKSMGAFPASTQFDLQAHINRQLGKDESVVVFPEGDVYRDGVTHPFKCGAARFALNAVRQKVLAPIIPIAIKYADDMKRVQVIVGAPIAAETYYSQFEQEPAQAVRSLTSRMEREVVHMRLELGVEAESKNLFTVKPSRSWAHSA